MGHVMSGCFFIRSLTDGKGRMDKILKEFYMACDQTDVQII